MSDFDPDAYVRARLAARKGEPGAALTGKGQARHSDPKTSRDAAAIDRTKQRGRVLEALAFENLVATEIAKRLRLVRDSVTPRLGELQKNYTLAGQSVGPLIEPTGETRPGPHGGHEQVYRLTPAGHGVVRGWTDAGER